MILTKYKVWEVIKSPQPIKATRPTNANATMADYYDAGNATTYLHLTISQRTVPLYKSYPQCPQRDDGWCDINTIMGVWATLLDVARYDYSCNGKYTAVAPGNISDGVPITKRGLGSFGSGLEMMQSSDRWVM